MTHRILVVDDEKTFRYFLTLHLKEQGYQVTEAADGQTAIKLIAQNEFDVALIDLRLTDMNGLDIMRHLRKVSPQTSVIILTGYATLDSAIEALRQGAHEQRHPVVPARGDALVRRLRPDRALAR